jgi:hypothetical protein
MHGWSAQFMGNALVVIGLLRVSVRPGTTGGVLQHATAHCAPLDVDCSCGSSVCMRQLPSSMWQPYQLTRSSYTSSSH